MSDRIGRYLDGAEANIRRFESLCGQFPAPVLNEWRYATRHVVNLLRDPGSADETEQAVRHLQRAYFDSCSLLLVAVLDKWDSWTSPFRAYPSLLNDAVPGWSDASALMAKARRMHRDFRLSSPADREAHFEQVAVLLDPMLAALDGLEDAMPSLERASRRERRKEFVSAGCFVVAVLTLAATIVAMLR